MNAINQADVTKLKALLEGFEDAILMTKAAEEPFRLHGRPMRIAQVEEDTSLWFFTGIDSGKVREVLADAEGYVVAQKSSKQVVLRGSFMITKSPEKIESLWSKPLEVWFPGGPSDSNVCLLRFLPSEAEFWDNSGVKGMKFLWESTKAFVSGTVPDVGDPTQHGKIDLDTRI